MSRCCRSAWSPQQWQAYNPNERGVYLTNDQPPHAIKEKPSADYIKFRGERQPDANTWT